MFYLYILKTHYYLIEDHVKDKFKLNMYFF